jgi:hypothetical protein
MFQRNILSPSLGLRKDPQHREPERKAGSGEREIEEAPIKGPPFLFLLT